jgi:hypothetical protein
MTTPYTLTQASDLQVNAYVKAGWASRCALLAAPQHFPEGTTCAGPLTPERLCTKTQN